MPLRIDLQTDYEDIGSTSRMPRRLMATVTGMADDLDQAIATFSQAANALTPMLAVIANAAVNGFELELGYDISDGTNEHCFVQTVRATPDTVLPKQRPIDVDFLQAFIEALLASPHADRVQRACVQYQEALGSWAPGGELRSVMHLWMAVEALTKAFLRRECETRAIDERGLCAEWGIATKQLDGEIRRRLIFAGDLECYGKSRTTSDGLEHMFESFTKLHANAAECSVCVAEHVRAAILSLIDLRAETRERLKSDPYDEPLQLSGLNRSIRGRVRGPTGRLAKRGFDHPHFTGGWRIKELVATDDDKYDLTAEDTFTFVAGDGIEFDADGLASEIPLKSLGVQVIRGEPTSKADDSPFSGS